MAVSIPDTLTANSSERYILSIRITPDGFSFSGTIPDKRNSFFYRQLTFDRSKDYATSLKEAFFEEECLAWSYKKVRIFCFTPNYIVIPDPFYDAEKKDELMKYAFFNPMDIQLSNELKAKKGHLIFGIQKDVYEFLTRSFVKPEFIHHMTYPCNHWKVQNELAFSEHMNVILNKKTIDLACFKHGELIQINSYDYTSPDDVLYLITCAWQQAGLSQLKDRLCIFGNWDYKKDLISKLRLYIHYVSEMELPTDIYFSNPDIQKAPYDLILSICE